MNISTLSPVYLGPTNVLSGGGVFTVIERHKQILGSGWHIDTNERLVNRIRNILRLLKSKDNFSIIMIHDIWTIEGIVLSYWKRSIIFPHGMLDDYAISNHKRKHLFLVLLSSVTKFASLTDREEIQIRALKPKSTIYTLINTVDTNFEPSLEERRGYVYLGRITEKKNIEGLLKGFLSSSGVVLDFYGFFTDDDIEQKFFDLIQDNKKIRYRGKYNPSEIGQILAMYKFLILPSFSEGLPMVCLEALAFGCGLIVSDNCNLNPEIFDGHNVLSTGTDIESIKEAVNKSRQVTPDPRRCQNIVNNFYGTQIFKSAIKDIMLDINVE